MKSEEIFITDYLDQSDITNIVLTNGGVTGYYMEVLALLDIIKHEELTNHLSEKYPNHTYDGSKVQYSLEYFKDNKFSLSLVANYDDINIFDFYLFKSFEIWHISNMEKQKHDVNIFWS